MTWTAEDLRWLRGQRIDLVDPAADGGVGDSERVLRAASRGLLRTSGRDEVTTVYVWIGSRPATGDENVAIAALLGSGHLVWVDPAIEPTARGWELLASGDWLQAPGGES